jgi:hypothetical protein
VPGYGRRYAAKHTGSFMSALPQFQPVTEAPWYEVDPPWPWPIADIPAFTEFPLNANMSDREVGSMVAALCDPLEIESSSDISAYLHALADLDCLNLRGGLALIEDSGIIMSRGCCTGVEDWRELYEIRDQQSPWMGHDPDMWCDFPDEKTVQFWSSGGTTGEQVGPMVSYSQSQVADELQRFRNSLTKAAERFGQWLESVDCKCTDALVDKFNQSFAVSVNDPLYKTVG